MDDTETDVEFVMGGEPAYIALEAWHALMLGSCWVLLRYTIDMFGIGLLFVQMPHGSWFPLTETEVSTSERERLLTPIEWARGIPYVGRYPMSPACGLER